MTPELLQILCDPIDGTDLVLITPEYDGSGRIIAGMLQSNSGRSYPIRNGIPRFVESDDSKESVAAFGEQWNFFNFDFRRNWLDHTVANTFGSVDAFVDKVIVDAGAGSGMQSRWMSEAGAKHVIALELSHTVDGIMMENLKDCHNVDVVQCSIDAPPLKAGAIHGIVICHNVIQHTPSVEKTARALWRTVGDGGEFVFNCYRKGPPGTLRDLRFALSMKLRDFLSQRTFQFRLTYCRFLSLLRFIPILGLVLEKANLMQLGDVPPGPKYVIRRFNLGVLNTFDYYGAHTYQHYLTDEQLRTLALELQPDNLKITNQEAVFQSPPRVGAALRVRR